MRLFFLTRDASEIHHNQEKMTLSCSTTSSPEPPTGRRSLTTLAVYFLTVNQDGWLMPGQLGNSC
jgi:hypothetical protein